MSCSIQYIHGPRIVSATLHSSYFANPFQSGDLYIATFVLSPMLDYNEGNKGNDLPNPGLGKSD